MLYMLLGLFRVNLVNNQWIKQTLYPYVSGDFAVSKSQCLAVAPIFCWRVTGVIKQPKHHRHAQEYILRISHGLVSL